VSLEEESAANSGGSRAVSGRTWPRRPYASDWGLWRTFTANLEALGGYLERFDLKDESKERITERVRTLLGRIEEEPKTFGWKMRAKIGDRKRWYDLPEEVEGGP
jgi:hypothetical protein